MAENPATVVAAAGETVTSVAPSKKAKSVLSPPKAQAKPTHPAYAEMVNAAIEELKERGGSSLQAIKKYITETYKVDTEKQALFIKRYIKAAVASGILIQTKGKGAAGSFKLPITTKAPKPKASTAKPKRTVKVPTSKKSAAVEKSTSPKKAAAKKSSKAVAEKNKVPKGPAAKPPKPKTTKAKSTPKSPIKKAKPTSSPKKTKLTAAQQKKAAPKKTAAQAK